MAFDGHSCAAPRDLPSRSVATVPLAARWRFELRLDITQITLVERQGEYGR